MPPIRRVLVLAVDGAESLDVMGPVEVFDYAERAGARLLPDRRGRPARRRPDHDEQRPAARRRVRCRSRRRATTRSSWPAARARAARSTTRRSSTGSRAPRGARGARRRSAPAPTCWPPRACWTGAARRRTGSTATAWPQRYPAVRARPRPGVRPRRRRLDLGRRDRRHRPRAGAGRGRSRRGGRAGGRAVAGRVPQAPRRPVAVQRRAVGPAGRRGRRCASCRRGSPAISTRTSRSRRSPPARDLSERSFARAFRAEVGQTPGRLRRDAARRARPRAAGGRRRVAGGGRPRRRASPAPRSCAARSTGAWASSPAAYRERFRLAA